MATKKPLEYKGHPLRRKDSVIYYGSMEDKYIIMMQINETKPVQPASGSNAKEIKVASRVSVQLQLTDPAVKTRDRVIKKTEKDSLYAAIDVASVWLERALSQK